MNTKMIITVCLLLASIAVQAAGALPQGRWEVAQVTIEKNTDGNIQTTVYNSVSDVKSRISCPQEWEISAQNIVLRYPDGMENIVKNILEDNQLTVYTFDGSIQLYQCSINGGNFILTATYDYMNMLPAGQIEKITEKWVITLKKQNN